MKILTFLYDIPEVFHIVACVISAVHVVPLLYSIPVSKEILFPVDSLLGLCLIWALYFSSFYLVIIFIMKIGYLLAISIRDLLRRR